MKTMAKEKIGSKNINKNEKGNKIMEQYEKEMKIKTNDKIKMENEIVYNKDEMKNKIINKNKGGFRAFGVKVE